MAVVIAANRTRHPLDARILARLAAQYADRGVVGFGLSNDERRGSTRDFAPAFRIAERAGLLLDPHGGELLGPESVRVCVEELHAGRLGHGIRAAEDPDLLDLIVSRGIALEVCPVSNVALGVYTDLSSVPLPDLMAAGATIALGADDPLLFGSQLAGQYATMRAAHELTDDQLADLARSSFRASRAPDSDKEQWLERDRRLVGDNERMTTYPGRGPRRSPRTNPRTRAAQDQPEDPRSRAPSRPSRSATGSARRPSRRGRRSSRAIPRLPQRRGLQPDQRPAVVGVVAARGPEPHSALRAGPVRPAALRPGFLRPESVRPGSLRPAVLRPTGARAGYGYPPPPGGQSGMPPAPGYPPYAFPPPRPDHPQSNLALILGIVGLVAGFLCGLGFVVSPFAWALGRNAVKEIQASQGRLGGEGTGQGRDDHRHRRHGVPGHRRAAADRLRGAGRRRCVTRAAAASER